MAIRRVFRTRAQCAGIEADLGPTVNQHAMIGRVVTLEKGPHSEVNVLLNGAVVGCIDARIGAKVVAAIDRGQLFSATIEKAFPIYNEKFKVTGAYLDIKVEYLLEKGQPAIETEKCWRCVDSPNDVAPAEGSFVSKANDVAHAKGSYFTKVAGVSFKGRQRIVARCSVGEHLILVRDPYNRYDKGAIKVLRSNGEQLGFIPHHFSRYGKLSRLASRMDRGDKFQCRISEIRGGGLGRNLGVSIEITEGEDVGFQQTSTLESGPRAAPPDGSLGLVVVMVAVVLVLVVVVSHGC